MLRGNWKGKVLGSGSDAWKYWDERRAGKISDSDWVDVEAGIARSYWHLHDHGHRRYHDGDGRDARHVAARRVVDPGGRCRPYPHGFVLRARRIVDMVWEDLTPKKILTHEAFLNAITVAMAVGCSTNAIIHLIALARRAGQKIGLDDFERASRKVPVIANIRPSGDKYLMEDFFYAGGLPGLLEQIRDHLHLDALTVTGKTLGEKREGRGNLQ